MAPRKSTAFELERSLSHLLRRAQQFAYDQYTQQLTNTGLTSRQFIVLLAVSEEEGLSQTDLVNRTGIDRSTLADMISRMIKRGHLARKRTAEDARANSVRLTAAGRKALQSAMPRATKAEDALNALISKTAQRELVKGLTQFVNAAEASAEEETAPAPARKTAVKKKTAAKKTAAKKKAPARKTAAKKKTVRRKK